MHSYDSFKRSSAWAATALVVTFACLAACSSVAPAQMNAMPENSGSVSPDPVPAVAPLSTENETGSGDPPEKRSRTPSPSLSTEVEAYLSSTTFDAGRRVALTSLMAAEEPKKEAAAATAAPKKHDAAALARAAQNPVAPMIQLPIKFNFNPNFGLNHDDLQGNIQVQPVIPVNINDDWRLLARLVLPIEYQPGVLPGMDSEFGLGNSELELFFVPKKKSKYTWGVGPVILLPTSTDRQLGASEWGLGPTFVVLTHTGPWVGGVTANQIWSFDGDFSELTVQPFINYNIKEVPGLYLTYDGASTANWKASGEKWTVPIGGGVGKVMKIGKLPVNIAVEAFYNVVRPDLASNWSFELKFQLMFPD